MPTVFSAKEILTLADRLYGRGVSQLLDDSVVTGTRKDAEKVMRLASADEPDEAAAKERAASTASLIIATFSGTKAPGACAAIDRMCSATDDIACERS